MRNVLLFPFADVVGGVKFVLGGEGTCPGRRRRAELTCLCLLAPILFLFYLPTPSLCCTLHLRRPCDGQLGLGAHCVHDAHHRAEVSRPARSDRLAASLAGTGL